MSIHIVVDITENDSLSYKVYLKWNTRAPGAPVIGAMRKKWYLWRNWTFITHPT